MKSSNINGREMSPCYLGRDGRYPALHRTKKEQDENGGKWIGVGGGRDPAALAREQKLPEEREPT